MTSPQAPVGRLVVCATPIGNLQDVTIRVLDALRAAHVVACEDTRHTRLLLERHGISTRTVSVHEHNERARAGELVERMRSGETVALVSDAGTPLVSDPGFALVRACVQAGIHVEALPGPSAVLAALVVSGLPCDRWRFVGFLPRARRQLGELLAGVTDTLVAFESPARLAKTLELLAAQDPARAAAVCRELTKLHEEVRRGSAAELAAYYGETPARGEVVLVVGAAELARAPLQEALVAVRELIDAGAKPRPAAAAVAKLTGLRANELYREITRDAPTR
jgi:16S rRNA (cytidine1402-2'-O)-methyltransferase